MNKRYAIYSSPEMTLIALEAEQFLLASSNEELLEDPEDYIDFFE